MHLLKPCLSNDELRSDSGKLESGKNAKVIEMVNDKNLGSCKKLDLNGNGRLSIDEFSGVVLDVTFEHDFAYLIRIDDSLHVYHNDNIKHAKIGGSLLSKLFKTGRALEYGCYNCEASGKHIFDDIVFAMHEHRNTYSFSSAA
jgi:hypothetical protein